MKKGIIFWVLKVKKQKVYWEIINNSCENFMK